MYNDNMGGPLAATGAAGGGTLAVATGLNTVALILFIAMAIFVALVVVKMSRRAIVASRNSK